MEKNSQAIGRRGRFLPNLVTNLFNFTVTFGLGIWFTPFLIKSLGTAHFGLIPLATTLASYMAIITNSLNHSTARYLSIEIEQKNFGEANSIFNSALFINLIAVLMLAPLAVWFSISVDGFVDIPSGEENRTRILFGFASLAFLAGVTFSTFGISTFCLNRFDLRNLWSIVRNVIRVGLVVLIFSLSDPKIWHVGLALLIATLVEGFGYIWTWRSLTPVLKIAVSSFKWDASKKLCSTSGWTMLTQAGTILFLGIDLLIINRLLGAEPAGRYATVLQWSAILRTVAGTIAAIFAPNIMMLYARNDIEGLTKYTGRAVKFVGLMLAVPIGVLCGFSAPLLELWLGEGFADLNYVLILLVGPLVINLAILPVFSLLLAHDAMKIPGYVTIILGVVNLALAIFFIKFLGWGLYGVAAATAITLSAKNFVFFPIYASRMVNQGSFRFYGSILNATVGALVIWLLAWLATQIVQIDSVLVLILASAVVCFVFALVAFFVLLSSEERQLFKHIVTDNFFLGRSADEK